MTAPSLGAYARSLARPVARGLLPLCHAQAALRVTVYCRARDGTLGGDGDPEDAFRLANVLLDQHLSIENGRLAETRGRILRALKPLIGLRRKVHELLTEARAVNAEAGFPLTGEDIEKIVDEQLWWALPRRLRHG